MIRNPVVAGQFYPGTKNSLYSDIDSLIDSRAMKLSAIGAVAPHAGYIYSGSVAGAVYSSIKPRKTYIILGPNHTGAGERFGLDVSTSWKTPLGEVKVDRPLAKQIVETSDLIKYDGACHMHEHSIEVQLPFLQVLQKDFNIVPITVSFASVDECRRMGLSIADSCKEVGFGNDVTIVSSSDMTHYESSKAAEYKDTKAIEAILRLDEKALLDTVAAMDISMCGVIPTAIMISAAKALGAQKARLVRYQTSGDASGDYSSVVGYAGIIIE